MNSVRSCGCVFMQQHDTGKMHSDWFNGIEILQGRWQHGEKVGYCYPSGLEKTLCKWDIYVPLVTKGLNYPLHVSNKQLFIISRLFLYTQHTVFYRASMRCLAATTM
jgi:hypothetical protein